uniref:Tetratricopeptide repeat protein 7 N-terminal domain-containing protein n=1 Tax=Knipowitschia caucasica TaxID=637954 RepID=A0AAV2JNC5_KNICA
MEKTGSGKSPGACPQRSAHGHYRGRVRSGLHMDITGGVSAAVCTWTHRGRVRSGLHMDITGGVSAAVCTWTHRGRVRSGLHMDITGGVSAAVCTWTHRGRVRSGLHMDITGGVSAAVCTWTHRGRVRSGLYVDITGGVSAAVCTWTSPGACPQRSVRGHHRGRVRSGLYVDITGGVSAAVCTWTSPGACPQRSVRGQRTQDPGPWTLDPGPWTLDPGPKQLSLMKHNDLGTLLLAECLLEECLQKHMEQLRRCKPLEDKTVSKLSRSKNLLNTALSRGRLTPRYLNEALLLMAKVHYVQGRYRDAQGMCARVGLEELTQDDQPIYHLRLLAEAFVIKGLSLGHQTATGLSRVRLSEREEESLSCFLKACDAALSFLQELDKHVSTPHSKTPKSHSPLPPPPDIELGYFLQAALQSGYLCLLHRGWV